MRRPTSYRHLDGRQCKIIWRDRVIVNGKPQSGYYDRENGDIVVCRKDPQRWLAMILIHELGHVSIEEMRLHETDFSKYEEDPETYDLEEDICLIGFENLLKLFRLNPHIVRWFLDQIEKDNHHA